MTTFTFGGVNLSDFGKITVIDGYLDMPDKRGGNQVIPFRHGSIYVPKYYNERTITFGIAIIEPTLGALEEKLQNLRSLLSPSKQQTLSITYEDSSVKTVQATVDKALQVSRTQTMARVVIEFTLCQPFFRSLTDIDDNTTVIDASPRTMEVINPGTIEERDPIIILAGPLSNTIITNTTNGCVLSYNGTIASPRIVTIQTHESGQYMATNDLDENVIANISHSGASALMVFDVGLNVLSITDDIATTGTVKVVFKAPYL